MYPQEPPTFLEMIQILDVYTPWKCWIQISICGLDSAASVPAVPSQCCLMPSGSAR